MTDILTKVGAIIVGLAIAAILISIIAAWPLMLLWNWLMPAIFGLVKITFWQAFGLIFLCSILFKSSNTSNN